MRNAIRQNFGTLSVCFTLLVLGVLDFYQHGRSAADRAHLKGVVEKLRADTSAVGARVTGLEKRFRSMTEPPTMKPRTEDAPK